MNRTDNFKKHQSTNPIQKLLIDNFHKTIISCLKPLNVESVLDAGCGEGFVLSELKSKGIGRQLEGVDFSIEALELGRKMFPELILKKADIYQLPYEDNAYDLVICTEVLEHLEKPEKVLNEIRRVSKKYCLFSVPNEPFFRMANFIRGKNVRRWGNDLDHIQFWSRRGFEKFISGKLNVITAKKPFPWTVILSEK